MLFRFKVCLNCISLYNIYLEILIFQINFRRLSWFLVYAAFVILLGVSATWSMFTLGVFRKSNFFLILILIVLYGFSIINLSFMLIPFFTHYRVRNKRIFLYRARVKRYVIIDVYEKYFADCRSYWKFYRQHYQFVVFDSVDGKTN